MKKPWSVLDEAMGQWKTSSQMQGCLGELGEDRAGDGIRVLYHCEGTQQITASATIAGWMQGICLVEYRELQCIA